MDSNVRLLTLPCGSLCRSDLLDARYARGVSEPSRHDDSWRQSVLSVAEGPHFPRHSKDRRSPSEKDLHRIVYSGYIQRLSGVTQVVTPGTDNPALHSRSVHSAKVAYLAKSIATNMIRHSNEGLTTRDGAKIADVISLHGGLDIPACEAAGWAHDIGHPPFGHIGEHIIDKWLRESDEAANGFEGNAQTFRALVRLDRKGPDSLGLELTNVALAAVQKYPWLRDINDPRRADKFGSYITEEADLKRARAWFTESCATTAEIPDRTFMQSLEASVMDVADDITYAMHDLQDFILAKVLSPLAVARDLRTASDRFKSTFEDDDRRNLLPQGPRTFIEDARKLRTRYAQYFDETLYKDSLDWAATFLSSLDVQEGEDPDAIASVRGLIAERIGSLVDAVEIFSTPAWPAGPAVNLEQETWHKVQVLKRITRAYVIETPLIGLHQAAQHTAMTELLQGLEQWCARDESGRSLPLALRAHLRLNRSIAGDPATKDVTRRSIVDYCCGLTDEQAYQLAGIIQGHKIPRVTR